MMLPRPFLLLLLLLCCHITMAQVFTLDKEINELDSLIKYSRFAIAQKKIDSLYRELSNTEAKKKHKAGLLEIRYRHVVLLDRKDHSPPEVIRALLAMIDQAEEAYLHSLCCRIYLMMALAHEKSDNFEVCNKYLTLAYQKYKIYKLEKDYSTYCIRKASYHRFRKEFDLMFYYATKAKEYAQKYHNETDLNDSYTLLGNFYSINNNYDEALKNRYPLLAYYKKVDNHNSIATSYMNIANIYFKVQEFSAALAYNDSAYTFYKDIPLLYKVSVSKRKYEIFEALGRIDSAYYYFKQYHNDVQLFQEEERELNTRKLEGQYQNDKKEAVIKTKNQQMILIGSLLGVILIASFLLAKKNREINKQNKVISTQVLELSKTLEQKQMLLSELQHRVKNNLQHVISILEIQKESVDFNSIEELIRENQNRIHSMALLHKKLNVSANVNDVDFERYLVELSALVKESYDNHKKQINLTISCEVETFSIEKALPLGLIIVELVSNSMKHAFKKRTIGIINIGFTKTETGYKFYYSDNGEGFDFNKTSEKGLGQEIIRGLIDQLDGTIKTNSKNGFELTVYFK